MGVQFLVRDAHAMIDAPVQCDVDGIAKRLHGVSVAPIKANLGASVARIEQSDIRESHARPLPDFTAFNPGYKINPGYNG
jgi:hypothetical protein